MKKLANDHQANAHNNQWQQNDDQRIGFIEIKKQEQK